MNHFEGRSNQNQDIIARNAQEDRESEIHPDVRNVYRKAKELFLAEGLKEDSFADLYGSENVATDKQKIESMKANWQKDNPTLVYATSLEYLVYRHINSNRTLGERARAIKTTEYDDVINGTDLVVEFEDSESARPDRLGFAIDVTFGSQTLTKKFDSIKKQIEIGTLGKMKYYHSPKQGLRGELSLLPRVVVGIEKNQIEKLATLTERGGIEALKGHGVTKAFLHEISVQLRTFATYAERKGQKDIAKIYRRELGIIQAVTSEAYGNDMTLEGLREDRVLQSIRQALGDKF